MEKDIVKKLVHECIKKIKNGDTGAHDEFLRKLKEINNNFNDYVGAVFLMFEEWGLKEKIDAAQLKLMWDGVNETYENDLKKILKE